MTRTACLLLALLSAGLARGEPALERALVGQPFAAESPVDDLALSADRRVVLGAVGGRVALWEASSGRRLGELPAPRGVDALVTAGGLLVTGHDASARVQVWDAAQGALVAELALEPDYDPVWELSSGSPPRPAVALAVAPDDALLAVAWRDQVRVLRLPDLVLVRWLQVPPVEPPHHPDWADVHHLRWDPSGRALSAWSAQRDLGWSWDLTRAPVAVSLPSPVPGAEWVLAAAALEDGDLVELRSGRAGYRLVRSGPGGAPSWSTPVAASEVVFDTRLLALEDREVVLLAGPASSARFALTDGRREAAAGPAGLRGLFAGSRDGALVLWDRRDRLWTWDVDRGGEPFRLATPLDAGSDQVALFDVDPSLRWAAAELRTGEVVVWDLRMGEVAGRWRDGDSANLTGLAVRDGQDGPRCFYNALHGEGRVRVAGGHTLVDYGQGVRLVARGGDADFGRDPQRGTRFAAGPAGRRLLVDDAMRVVDVETGDEALLGSALRFTHAAALSPDGRRVAVAGLLGSDSVLLVLAREGDAWREARRAPLRGMAQGVTFDARGLRVAAVDQDGALALDLAGEGQSRIALAGGAAAAFLPDGRLVLGARDGSVTVWSLER